MTFIKFRKVNNCYSGNLRIFWEQGYLLFSIIFFISLPIIHLKYFITPTPFQNPVYLSKPIFYDAFLNTSNQTKPLPNPKTTLSSLLISAHKRFGLFLLLSMLWVRRQALESDLLLTSSMTLGKLLNLPKAQFLHLKWD